MKIFHEITKGLIKENPIFRLLLGMCPALAITTSVENALGMGLAVTVVLVGSNAVIAAIRSLVPATVRIPCYIIVIAGFTTIIQMFMQAFATTLYENLGIFIPLIVVNCVVLGRAEAFAARNGVLLSMADGLGMGLGYLGALLLVAAVRVGIAQGVLLAILPPGGFIILGALLAAMNAIKAADARRKGAPAPQPLTLDCRHCAMGCGIEK